MPSVHGILETALYVANLSQSAVFYERLFGFGRLLESERLIALDVSGRSVLLLFLQGATGQPFATPGGVIPGHSGAGLNHFAFAITREDYQPWREELGRAGVTIESEVAWEGGALSLYFRDPDRNLVELITPGFWRTY